jgi:hypothetical protein
MKIKFSIVSALLALLFIAGCGNQCSNSVCFSELANDPFAVSYRVIYVISFDPNQVQRSANADSEGCFAPDGIRNSQNNLVCPDRSQISILDFTPIEEDDAWYGDDSQMMHDIGQPDSAADGGWSATVGQDGYGLLMYGPAYAYYPNGNYTAGWKLMITSGFMGSAYFDNTQEVELDVIDVITSQELGYNIITADQFKNMYDYEAFSVPFTVTNSTHPIQLRCIWMGQANITTLGCGLGVNKQ